MKLGLHRWEQESKDAMLVRCQTVIKTLQQLLSAASLQKTSLADKLVALQTSCSKTQLQLREAEAKGIRLKQETRKLCEQVAQLQRKLDQTLQQNQRLRQIIQAHRQQKEGLQKEWQSVLEEVETKIDDREVRKRELEKCLTIEKEQAARLRESVAKEEMRASRLQQVSKEIQRKEQECDKHLQRISKLERENSSLKMKLQSSAQYFTLDQSVRRDHEQRASRAEQSVAQLKDELAARERETLILKHQNENLAERLQRQRMQYRILAKNMAEQQCHHGSMISYSPIRNLQTSKTPVANRSLKVQDEQFSPERKRKILEEAARLQALLTKSIREVA